jgi:hypothetical protein
VTAQNSVEYQTHGMRITARRREQKPFEYGQKSEIGGLKSRKKSRINSASSRVVPEVAHASAT